jgi:hypothetical protein
MRRGRKMRYGEIYADMSFGDSWGSITAQEEASLQARHEGPTRDQEIPAVYGSFIVETSIFPSGEHRPCFNTIAEN